MKDFRIDFINPHGLEESAYYTAVDKGTAQEMFNADFGDDFAIDDIVDIDGECGGDYDDSMDGDFDSGMASAGYGMDEDYGGGCEQI